MGTNIPRLYADFNNADALGRLRLITQGSLADIAAQNIVLSSGMRIIVHDDELSAEGEVVFSEEERVWVVKIDWGKI